MMSNFFFLSEFSFTDSDDFQDRMGREETVLISVYHFHTLTKIQTFFGTFACDMTTTYF